MAYEDPDKFISDSTLFFLPGAMILWLLIFMIVTLSYSVNSPPKIMPRAVNLGLVGVASVFMGLWLLGLMVCYCRGTFLKGRSGRDVAPKPPGWGEDMEKRMCQLEKQTKPPTPLPGQAQRNHQNAQIAQRDEREFQHNHNLLANTSPFHNNNLLIHIQYNQNLCVNTRPSNHKLSSRTNNKPIKTVYDAINQDPCLTDRGICPRPNTDLATANRLPAVQTDTHLSRAVTTLVSRTPRLRCTILLAHQASLRGSGRPCKKFQKALARRREEE
ncbi:hypothetical protein CGCS363_v005222 [Colletotrichum siamense]|uniref:uncharacterized protein n=1 Tax=Colletotrichum siamense TaxID=690259 RepID=UPI0018728CE5|nr:uncharacterized protein CGCS363_v005222 [Colletotrichum siamense]KAF5506728.1 hypothetical protein CGCS363_v005222 [Colletotrichum siamense]